jgi:hypothetical protein
VNLSQIPAKSAARVEGQTVTEAKESLEEWVAVMLQSVHRKGYRAPEIRRVYILKPGKQQMRPLGVPTVADRALQRSVSQVLSAIYEQDFLSCSFGGPPARGAPQALVTLHQGIVGAIPADQRTVPRCFEQSCMTPTESCRLLPYCESTSVEPSAGNLHAGFCGSRRRVTASGRPVAISNDCPYRDLQKKMFLSSVKARPDPGGPSRLQGRAAISCKDRGLYAS